ncbi:hypothetical protein NMY22_g16049 [Coprinellus aureogranulatus]|nr:hypothetical protein NMY22_g16049 [Coprinellus aureogranulatus]
MLHSPNPIRACERPKLPKLFPFDSEARSVQDSRSGLSSSRMASHMADAVQTPPYLHTQPIMKFQYEKLLSPGPFASISGSIADKHRVFLPKSPKDTPFDIFSVQHNRGNPQRCRFIRKGDPNRSQALIFIDGSRLDKTSTPEARTPCAGCGIVFGPIEYDYPLYAAIAALHQEPWWKEGFDNIVLATDSLYLVQGISEWVHVWKENGWKLTDGSSVKNRDLWEALLAKLRDLESVGTLAQFWWIPKTWNEADKYAEEAAYLSGICDSSGHVEENETHPELVRPSFMASGRSVSTSIEARPLGSPVQRYNPAAPERVRVLLHLHYPELTWLSNSLLPSLSLHLLSQRLSETPSLVHAPPPAALRIEHNELSSYVKAKWNEEIAYLEPGSESGIARNGLDERSIVWR